jgi:hypothetical protein
MLKDMKNHPMVKKALAAGEERMGKIVSQLLSNEKFVAGIQTMVASALSAKGSLDKSLKRVLTAMNLPTIEDVQQLRAKLDELETILDGVNERVTQLAEKKRGRGEDQAQA